MGQNSISISVLDSKSSFPSIDIDIGFEINACQPEILISNLNEQFRTTLLHPLEIHIFFFEIARGPGELLKTGLLVRLLQAFFSTFVSKLSEKKMGNF